MDFIKDNIFLVSVFGYAIILGALAGLNLDKTKRYKQSSNIILLSGLIIVNFGIAYYLSEMYDYDNFFKEKNLFRNTLNLIYYFSGLIIGIMLIIKKLLLKVISKKELETKDLKDYSPYERLKNGYYLKNHYKFFRDVVKILVWIFGVLTLVSTYITVYKINIFKPHKDIIGVPYLPLFSILGLIFMFELYSYLNGEENKITEKNNIKKPSEDKVEEDVNSFGELFNDYKKTWSSNIMGSIYKKNIENNENNQIIEENIKNKDVEEVYFSLKKKFEIKPNYLGIMQDLFDGKDTIITDSNYEEIAPFIFSYLEKSILKGKKILVLAETDLYTNIENRELIKNWFENCFIKLYKKSIRKIVTFDDWKTNTNWDILIGTQSEIIKHQQDFIEKIQAEQNELEDLVIFVINEKLDEIAENILTLSILSNILNTHFKVDKNEDEGAQYIILSNSTANLDVAINTNLGINAKEHNIRSANSKNFYGIIWKADTRKEYYTEIMDGVPKVELGIASTLSYLAWNYGFKNINFMEQNNLPYSKYEDNIEIAKDYLKDRPIKKSNLNDLYKNIIINNPITSLVKKRNKNILFVEDKIYNSPVLIKKFSSLGKDEVFVNIVSENYLLRDYFVDNIDYFAHSPHYGYTPKIESNSYKVAAYLKEILTNTQIKVSEEDIKKEMMSIQNNIKNVEEELTKLFLSVYNIDILKRDYLTIETENIYSVEKKIFEEVKYYSLNGDISKNSSFKWFENFEIVDSGGRSYGTIAYEHIYQNYLKGQVHCFNGKSYLVENIDLINKKINISPAEKVKRIIYRNNDTLKINKIDLKEKNNFATVENAEYILKKKTQFAEYEVETTGYHEFLGGISLKNQDYKYNDLNSLGEKFIRDYNNGQILSVNLKIKDFKILNYNNVAISLTVLFNEIFRTVFPENYKYVKIFTFVPEDFYGTESDLQYFEEGFVTPEYLAHILPSKVTISKTEFKNLFDENMEDQINLYFVEDSYKDIGLIRAISDNFEDILRLIQDYLNWLTDGDIPKKGWDRREFRNNEKLEYLKYGLDSLAKELDLKELTYILNKILGENKFTEARKRYYDKVTSDAEKEDDFDKEYAYLKSRI